MRECRSNVGGKESREKATGESDKRKGHIHTWVLSLSLFLSYTHRLSQTRASHVQLPKYNRTGRNAGAAKVENKVR